MLAVLISEVHECDTELTKLAKEPQTLNRFLAEVARGKHITETDVLYVRRPLAGVFAFVMSLGYFLLYGKPASMAALYASLCLAFITMNIMVFNDLVDREHDVKKGKTFARDNFWNLGAWWLASVASICLYGLWAVATHDIRLAVFVGGLWVIGLFYSFTRRWFLVPNLLVAICSALPVFLGAVEAGVTKPAVMVIFVVMFFVIFVREIVKDIEDYPHDVGYKATLPVLLNGRLALTPGQVKLAKRGIDVFLLLFLVAILLTPIFGG